MAQDQGYSVDWTAIDEDLDSGRRLRWVDAPAWRWYGSAYEDLMSAGLAECPICFDAIQDPDGSIRWLPLRGPRETCPYCLRSGSETDLPLRHPSPHVARIAEARFRAKVDGARLDA